MDWRLMSEPRGADRSAPPDEVRAQIERILCSQTLSGSDQLKRLLRLVVERTLDGQPELLKEYSLGLDVFQRPPDYDPKVDPIVRVQAGRLRSKLIEYYASEGAHDSLVIRIPKGAYVPVFGARDSAAPAPDMKSRRQRVWLAAAGLAVLVVVLVVLWAARDSIAVPVDMHRSVAVFPLQIFSESGSRGHIADQVAEVLTTELAKNKQLRILSRTTASKYRETTSSLPEIARVLGVRWVVEGGVGVQGSRVYVKLRAIDALTDRKVWADVFDCDLSELVAVNARAADSIAVAIEVELRSSQR
jgi:adenylate cyclase